MSMNTLYSTLVEVELVVALQTDFNPVFEIVFIARLNLTAIHRSKYNYIPICLQMSFYGHTHTHS